MPAEARNRAQRCRARAEECFQIAASAPDPHTKKHYELLAEEYQRVAAAEEALADKLESAGRTDSADAR